MTEIKFERGLSTPGYKATTPIRTDLERATTFTLCGAVNLLVAAVGVAFCEELGFDVSVPATTLNRGQGG